MFLANNQETFHVKIQGDKTKEWFEGDFTVLCLLDMGQQMDVALRTDRYNGGSKTLPEQFKLFNRMIAELDVRVTKSPTWWSESSGGWNLHDTNIVREVFVKAIEAEDGFGKKVAEKAETTEARAEKQPAKKADEKAATG